MEIEAPPIFTPIIEGHVDEITQRIMKITKESWVLPNEAASGLSKKAKTIRTVILNARGSVWSSDEANIQIRLWSEMLGENITLPSEYLTLHPGMCVVPTGHFNAHNYSVDRPALVINSVQRWALRGDGSIGNSLPNRRSTLRMPNEAEVRKLVAVLAKKAPLSLSLALDGIEQPTDS